MTTKMQDGGLTAFYEKSAVVERLTDLLSDSEVRVHVDGMTGSLPAAVIAAMAGRLQTSSLLVMAPDKEAAYYMANDLEALMDMCEIPPMVNQLEFHPLIQCDTYAYLWKGHPLAGEKSIRPEQLAEYPCLTFEQGGSESFYFNEETLANAENLRIIKATDRASMLNLMVGLNGYTVCSGIICEELNGSDYVAVPFRGGEETAGSRMEIGYIIKQNMIMSNMAQLYIEELKRYLGTIPANIGSTVKAEKQG